VVETDGESTAVAEHVSTDVPPVWVDTDCYFLGDDGATVRRYNRETGVTDGTEVGGVSHLIGGLSGNRVAWVVDGTELVAAPRGNLAATEAVASELQIPDGPSPVVDEQGERIAYASRAGDQLCGYVTASDGSWTVDLGASVLPFDIAAERDELLVGTHPFAGAVGVYDLAADEVSWLVRKEKQGVPFPGVDRPVAFAADPSGIHIRRMVDYIGQPAVLDRDGAVRQVSLGGYFDGSVNSSPGGRLRNGRRLLVRESSTNPGEVLTYSAGDATTTTVFECSSLLAEGGKQPEPERLQFSGVDGGDGEIRLYRPDSEPPYPTVAELYGGNRTLPETFDRFGRYLAAHGICYARVLNPAVPWSVAEHRNHAAAADRLAAAEFVDEGRLVAYGFSMGGYDVRMQAVNYPDRWRGGVALSGHSDLLAFDDAVDGSPEIRSQLGDPDSNRELWERLSPRHQIDTVPEFKLDLIDIEDDFIPGSGALVERYRNLGGVVGEQLRWTELWGQEHNPRDYTEKLRRHEVVHRSLLSVLD